LYGIKALKINGDNVCRCFLSGYRKAEEFELKEEVKINLDTGYRGKFSNGGEGHCFFMKKLIGPHATLLITLWARVEEIKKKHPVIEDDFARDIISRIDFDFSPLENINSFIRDLFISKIYQLKPAVCLAHMIIFMKIIF
jgi:hypothetical protein